MRRLYLVFAVRPWAQKVARGLKKEKKWYYLDWAYVPEGPARLENMVAAALYRSCHTLSDMGYGRYRLHYVRTLDKKEIDFLVCRDNRPILAVEVKSARTQLARPLADRNAWLHLPASVGIQVVDTPDILQRHGPDTWVMSAERFLALLP